MKLLFKNKTKYTKEVYKTFLEFHNKKYGNSYHFYTAIITLLLFFCFGMNLKFHNFAVTIGIFIAMIAFLYWRFFHPTHEIQKELKKDKIQKEKEFQFRFFEKCIEILDKTYTSKFNYFKIKHIYETNKYFYLYIDKNHAFILGKSNFTIGNIDDFRTFIKHKCPLRYKGFSKLWI